MPKPFLTVEISSIVFFWLTIQFEMFPVFSFEIGIRMQLTCNFINRELRESYQKLFLSQLFSLQIPKKNYELVHKNPLLKLNRHTLTIFNFFSCHPLNCLSCGFTSFK